MRCDNRAVPEAARSHTGFTIDNSWPVGIIANMKAELLQRDRMDFDDGAILEMVIWHGLVVRTPDRKICVPYDVIHADFDLRAVA